MSEKSLRLRQERIRGQAGFTLIEMLVVISILGILAAVVTLGVVGVTSKAHQRAMDDELMQIQSAVNGMALDQRLDPGDICPTGSGPSQDMRAFPTSAPYAPPSPANPHPVAIHPHYLHGNPITGRAYVCIPNGAVLPAGG